MSHRDVLVFVSRWEFKEKYHEEKLIPCRVSSRSGITSGRLF